MPCYCGCGTKRSKALAALATILTLLLIASWVLVWLFNKAANDAADECVRDIFAGTNDGTGCGKFDRNIALRNAFLGIAVIFSIGATIPCYVMCCCNPRPAEESAQVAQTAPAVAVPSSWEAVPPTGPPQELK